MPVEMEIEEQFTHQQISIDKIEEHLDTEWLLSNSRGSYSSSTVLGCNTPALSRFAGGVAASAGRALCYAFYGSGKSCL